MSLNTQILIAAIFRGHLRIYSQSFPGYRFFRDEFVWNRGGQQYFYWFVKNALDSPHF